MRRALILCALLSSLFALPAFAIPGIGALYGGLGTHTYNGFPGMTGTDYGATPELGIDDVVQKLGFGIRLDLPNVSPISTAANLELRYSIVGVPFFRLIGGVFGGVAKDVRTFVGLNGTYGVFAAARISLGMPYLGINLGYQGVKTDLSPFGQVTLGVVF